jgi:hypothetical protein
MANSGKGPAYESDRRQPQPVRNQQHPELARQLDEANCDESSSGTLGLYFAMNILGFKSYHLYECFLVGQLPHIGIFHEAIIAQYNKISGIKRYTRADFDKWMGDYDVSAVSHSFYKVEEDEMNPDLT